MTDRAKGAMTSRAESATNRVSPSLSPDCMPPWPFTCKQYPKTGAPGLTVYRGYGVLYRGRSGKLLGVLQVWPPKIRDGRPGFTVHVDPGYRRHGVGTKLLRHALTHWPSLDLAGERYTEKGATLVNAVLAASAAPL